MSGRDSVFPRFSLHTKEFINTGEKRGGLQYSLTNQTINMAGRSKGGIVKGNTRSSRAGLQFPVGRIGIFLESDLWPPPPPLVSKMYKKNFFTILDNKINLTQKNCFIFNRAGRVMLG